MCGLIMIQQKIFWRLLYPRLVVGFLIMWERGGNNYDRVNVIEQNDKTLT